MPGQVSSLVFARILFPGAPMALSGMGEMTAEVVPLICWVLAGAAAVGPAPSRDTTPPLVQWVPDPTRSTTPHVQWVPDQMRSVGPSPETKAKRTSQSASARTAVSL